jgi:hypothetical protein
MQTATRLIGALLTGIAVLGPVYLVLCWLLYKLLGSIKSWKEYGNEQRSRTRSQHGQVERAERLARAVLLFHSGTPWTDEKRQLWAALTGRREATTKVLCDVVREIRAEAERASTPTK